MKERFIVSLLSLPVLANPLNFTVTAERLEKSLSKTSSSVSVISAREISQSGAQSLSEVLQSRAGVYLSSNGTFGGQSALRVRGSGSGFAKIIVDGIELNDPTNPSGSFDVSQLDLTNIEQIEILRGAQSIIYGSNATGGVIKITTKKSDLSISQIDLLLGSFDTKSLSFNTVGKKERTSYSLAGSYYITDGISSFNENRTNFAESDRYNRINLKASLEHTLSHQAKITYQTQVLKSDLDIDSYGSDKRDKDNSSYDQNLHRISLQNQLLEGSLKSELSYNYNEIYRNSESSSTNNVGDEKSISWQGTHFLNESFTNIYGLEYEKQSATQVFSTNREKKTLDMSSVFMTTHYKSVKTFFDLGLRHDNHEVYKGHTTYKIGGGYQLPKDITVKANYATGFKSPTLTELNTGTTPLALEPTESKSFDVSLLHSTLWTNIELTYFQTEYDNQISYDSTDSRYENIAESELKGLEFSLAFNYKNYSLSNIYTYTLSKDLKTGLKLLKTPKKMNRTSLRYTIHRDFSFGTDFIYIGQRYDFGQKRIPSYLVGNFVVNYENFQLKVDNILDKEYEDTDTYGTAGRSYFLGYKIKL